MTPDYLNRYKTKVYKSFLIELVTQRKTKRALEVLYRTMPETSPNFARVVNFYNQFGEAETRKYDGLAGWQEEMSRINLALVHVLNDLQEEYPHTIPLRQSPSLIGQEAQAIFEPYEPYQDYEEETIFQPASSSGTGFGIILGLLLAGVLIFMLVRPSGGINAGANSPQPIYSAPQIGWVLLLEDGEDCKTLGERYDFVFRHHGDAEVTETNRGGCSLLIRFPDKATAEKRRRRSSSLKRTFPDSQVVKL